MKARLIKETEKQKYNNFLAEFSGGHILQSWEWGEVKKNTGWIPYRLVVEDDSGEILAAAEILKRDIPAVKKSIFYAPRGPAIDFRNSELLLFLLNAVRDLAKKENAIFLKIDPDIPVEDNEVKSIIEKNGFKHIGTGKNFEGIQPNFVMRLDITPSEEELMKSFQSKTRYNIRLAKKRNVKIKEDCVKEDLEKFYDILKITAQRDKFLIRSYTYFEIIWEELVKKGLAKLFMAYYDGQPISGTLAFVFGDSAWYIYGASDNKHRRNMPNYLLQWHMITWAKSKGCKMYDFRGVSGDLTPENPLYGLYRFKKGFNPDLVEFIGEYDLVYSKLYYRMWNTFEPLYGNLIRKVIKIKKNITR